MSQLRLFIIALLTVTALEACRFDSTLPEGVAITCGPKNECPTGSQCRTSLNRCFPVSTDVEAPVFTSGPTLDPRMGNLNTAFKVEFSVSEELGDLPLVSGVCDVGQTVNFVTEQTRKDTAFTFTWQVPQNSPQGVCRLVVRAFDRYGNLATAETPLSFFIDSLPPVPSLAGIEFAAAPGSPVPEVRGLGLEGRVFINFTTNEPVVGLPVLHAMPDVIEFDPVTVSNGVFSTRGTLKADAGLTAIAQLSVTLADQGGASGRQPLATSVPLVVDGQPPTFNADAGVPHIRVPRGAPSTSGAVLREIVGGRGNTEPGVTVRALSADGFTEFGRVVTGAAGEFTLLLPAPDQALVTLEAVDTAGNRSAPILVPQVEFRVVPDFDTRVAGTTGDSLVRFDGLTDVTTQLRRADGTSVVIQGNGSWRNRSRSKFRNAAPTVNAPAMAYNPALASTVFWVAAQVHRWNGEDSETATNVPFRAYGAMSYDRKRGVLVAFGGLDNGNDVVQESTDGRIWRTLNPVNGPGPRQRHVLVFDGEATQLLGSATLSPVFSWNGSAWSVVDAGALPNGVVAAAYDTQLNRVIALASADGGTPQTWQYQRKAWRQLTEVIEAPPSSVGGMVYDSHAHLIRFNGQLPDGGGERWSFQGDVWRDDGVGVPTTANAATAFDEARGIWFHSGLIGRSQDFRYVVAIEDGGMSQFSNQNDTPAIRYATGTTWDPQRHSLVIQGGKPTSLQYPADQWAWNGTGWLPDPVVDLPNLRNHTLTWSPAGNLVFGGYTSAGALSGVTYLSVAQSPGSRYTVVADAGPSPRADHSAINAEGSNVLLFGGVNNDGLLWTFNGATRSWSSLPGGVVESRQKMAVVKEPTTGTLMAIGGADSGSANDVVVRAGIDDAIFLGGPTQWQRVASLPSRRDSVAAVVDTDLQRVLVMGGRRPDNTAIDEFLAITVRDAGVTVTPLETSDPEADGAPQPRYLHGAVYDDVRHSMLVYSGYNGPRGFYDLWEYRFMGQRPSLTTAIDAREVDFTNVESVSLSATVVAGGLGYDGSGADVRGFTVEAFIDGHWVVLGTDEASTPMSMAPLPMTVTTGPLSVPQLATTLERISVRVVARGANHTEAATLAVDAIELALTFSRSP